MVRMIKRPMHTADSIASFYDTLAIDYDEMTEFEKRFAREKLFFQNLIRRYGIASAMDAGCGTGFHSLLLAQLGVRVVAVDISENMLHRLALHARAMSLKIKMVHSSFEDIRKNLRQKVDAVFSMGNSLPHLLSKKALRRTVKGFAASIMRSGILLVQILNYDRILASRERIQSIKEVNGKTFIRFYDYEGQRLRFNILSIRKQGSGLRHELNSVTLRPILSKELAELVNECGFGNVKLYGNISLSPYEPQKSHDLIILARRI